MIATLNEIMLRNRLFYDASITPVFIYVNIQFDYFCIIFLVLLYIRKRICAILRNR